MAKLNLVLLAALVVCALGMINAQHQARRLQGALEREQTRTHTLEIEYGRLQLEASTWALHARIERIAVDTLGMQAPQPQRVRVVRLPRGRQP